MDDEVNKVAEYFAFLDDELRQNIHRRRVQKLINENGQRFQVQICDLRKFLPNRCKKLLHNFIEEEAAFKTAIKKYVSEIDETYGNKYQEFFVGYYGSFGGQHITPRTLRCKFIGWCV